MTILLVTHGDRCGWQRRAAGELVRVLDAHRDLPLITWTVGPAGSVLVGQIHSLAPAGQVREHFQEWRLALGLEELVPTGSAEAVVTHLHAWGWRNQVRTCLTADVINNGGPR